MKKIIERAVALLLSALMLMSCVVAAPSAVTTTDAVEDSACFEEVNPKLLEITGEGTEEDPFLIETEEDLMLISDFPEFHFKLANDIALTAENWEPLCVLTDAFSGVFDGNGHTISNLTVKTNRIDKTGYYNGLFSRNAGTIKNLDVVTSDTGITGLSINVGVLVGFNSGTIENCRVSGIINQNSNSSYGSNIGGLVGKNGENGVVEKCYSNVSIYSDATYSDGGSKYVGGLVGYNVGSISKGFFDGSMDMCGTKTSSYIYPTYYVGGLVGYSKGASKTNPATIIDSAAITTILNTDGYGSFKYVSGLLGYSNNYTTVSNSYAVVSGSRLQKGFAYATYSSDLTVSNSFYDKGVSGLIDTGYGEPKTTAAMKMAATFKNAGWDFENTWAVSKTINGGYPYLQWMYQKNEDYTPAFDTSMQAYLNLDALISMSVCYKFDRMDLVNASAYLDSVGLLVWDADKVPEEATIENCNNVIAGAYYNSVLDRFETTTEGIEPKKLGDQLAFRAYYVDEDGNYTYSKLIESYSPKTYCYNRIEKNPDNETTVEFMAAVLNYGAAAQKYLGYKTDDLMNKDLPEELK